MRFKLDLKADGGNITKATNTTIINGSHSLIKHMVVRSAGKIIYDTDNLHLVTFAKNLLEYSDDYSRSVAKNFLWYLDTTGTHVVDDNTGFAARRLLHDAAVRLRDMLTAHAFLSTCQLRAKGDDVGESDLPAS